MTNKNSLVITALLTLIVGLLVGYFFGTNTMPRGGFLSGGFMQEEMEEHMYGDELIDGDGAMQHAMDEMMLGFRGLEGKEYEEAFLRGMIVHHLGAIAMAGDLLQQTDRPELIELANNIIESQTKEVDMMRGWLKTWFEKN